MIKKILGALLLSSVLMFGQNPNTNIFPTAIATDTDLFVANNGSGGTALNGSITNADTSIVLTSGTRFVAPVIIGVEGEIIHCTTLTTNTLTGCTRGLEGTSAVSHSSGVIVYALQTAWFHNQVAAEIKAIENLLFNFTPSPINLVQSGSNRGNPTTTLAYPQNVTSGHLLIYAGSWFSGANTQPVVTDGQGNTYTNKIVSTGGASNFVIATATAGSSGADTVTISLPSGAGFNGNYVTEWVGVTATADGSTSSTSAFNQVSITTTVAGDLVLMLTDSQASAGTGGCVGSLLVTQPTGGNDAGVLCYIIQNVAGKITNGAYISSYGGAAMLALKHQ